MNAPSADPGAPASPRRRRLLLGLGNDLLGDDAVGLLAVREARRQRPDPLPFDIRENAEAGLALLDEMTGFDEVLLVDAVKTGRHPPGFVHRIEAATLAPALALGSIHRLGVPEVLALGRALDLPMPASVRVLAVEVSDPFSITDQISPPVADALPRVVDHLLATLRAWESEP